MWVARNGASKLATLREDPGDAEVPAAVLCAHCGSADCFGCLDARGTSGIVSVVPWEHPGVATIASLWATARAATLDPDGFFESLPDGPLGPALRFAFLSEIVASLAMGLVALLPMSLAAPRWVEHLFVDHPALVVRVTVAGLSALATLLVAAHVVHGWALDWGARRCGARGAGRRAVRFGLYAAGWDLVIGPLGGAVVAFREGMRACLSIPRSGIGLPGRSARAFLRGCYRLEGKPAEPALRASYVAASLATLVGAVAIIALFAVALTL
ncbi:MAG: hypothetical protein M3O50_19860 [Myxococcota bacterium]|nr:hypothetical protein [Myxococcota bacterium]